MIVLRLNSEKKSKRCYMPILEVLRCPMCYEIKPASQFETVKAEQYFGKILIGDKYEWALCQNTAELCSYCINSLKLNYE